MTPSLHPDAAARRGFWFGLAAYGSWGLIPLYFKAVSHVGPLEVLAQRVLWACVFLSAVIAASGRAGDLRRLLGQPHILRRLTVSTALIAANWLIYIYAVSTGQVLEASLGYFITPLASVLLGLLVLHERLRALPMLGLTVAACGLALLVVLAGQVPWIALGLAGTFACYGLARKTLAVDGLLALAVETLLLLPLALAYIAYDHLLADGAWGRFGWKSDLLLAASGPITAVPLLCFGAAARRLKLTTLGFLQYLAPSLQFALAVTVFREPFTGAQVAAFGCAWAAVAIYTADSLLVLRGKFAERQLAPPQPVAEPS